MTNIDYIYGRKSNIDDPDVILGAKVVSSNETGIEVKEIYVGEEITSEELANNSTKYSINNLVIIFEKFETLGAVGFVYFPQANMLGYLESGDVVVPNVEALADMLSSENQDNYSKPLTRVRMNHSTK
ncbi:MAG: hypothetical protein RR478_00550 [Bacilli bacterium]